MANHDMEFDRGEIDRLTLIVAGCRDALVDRLLKEFSHDKVAEAVGLALAMLFASAFTDDPEQQHDAAIVANQVLARANVKIAWRMAPLPI